MTLVSKSLHRRHLLGAAVLSAGLNLMPGHYGPVALAAETPAMPPAAPHNAKDVVLAPAGDGTPAASPAALTVALPIASGDKPAAVASMATCENGLSAPTIVFSGALGDLGLHLLRTASTKAGNANSNMLVSPYGLANVLGMLYAGTAGDTAREIGATLEPGTAAGRDLVTRMKALTQVLGKKTAGVELVNANRLWVDTRIAAQMEKPFVTTVADAFHGDGVGVNFADTKLSVAQMNDWASHATAGQIPSLLSPDSLPATAKAVVTDVVYFKAAWRQPFLPEATRPMPFHTRPGQSVDVPTMSAQLHVRQGLVNGLSVLELPYAGDEFVMLIALPARAEHTLDALEQDTAGADIAEWLRALRPANVTVHLPRFRIRAQTQPLREALEAAGMRTAFGSAADFSPMVGKTPLLLDNVYHAAGITVDEQGSEATSASAAVARSKGLVALNGPVFNVDRPFLFAIVHKPTATPMFVGRMWQPEF